jgi:hypothetical protein
MTTKKAGRPKLPGRVKLTITMDRKIYEALINHTGTRSGTIEQALRLFLLNEIKKLGS